MSRDVTMATNDRKAFVEAWNAYLRDGIDALLPYIADDAVWEEYEGAPGAQVWHGRDGVRALFARWQEDFDGFRLELTGEPVELAPGTFAVPVRIQGTGRLSGAQVDIQLYQGVVMRDGLAVRATFAETLDEARSRLA